eukprot:SAG11_NODE_86_length_17300_cov_11.466717_11_plen_71_part_00
MPSATSTRCDYMVDTLNTVRINYGEVCHEQIAFLEAALHNLHRGQGLGFTVGGAVVDRVYLKRLCIKLCT